MSKLYYVIHNYQYYQDPENPQEKFFSKKYIGFVYSKKDALRLIEKYKELPGFRDATHGFYIKEYTINGIYNDNINSLITKSSKKASTLYSICYLLEHEDDDDEFEILALFSTRKKAETALRLLAQDPDLKIFKNQLDVYEEHLGRTSWEEGFIKWAPTPKEKEAWGID